MFSLPKFIAVAACDVNGVIGNKGSVPWNEPEELEHFYQTIRNHPIIMGYSTYLTLPPKIFQNRYALVLTKQHKVFQNHVISIASLAELEAFYRKHAELLKEPNFVIGGEKIFDLFFHHHLIHTVILTHLEASYTGDAYFPLHYLKDFNREVLQNVDRFSIVKYTKTR